MRNFVFRKFWAHEMQIENYGIWPIPFLSGNGGHFTLAVLDQTKNLCSLMDLSYFTYEKHERVRQI